jgi:hypothetical protein
LRRRQPFGLPHADQIVYLHHRRLVLEKARHDEVVRTADGHEAVELAQLSAQVAEREHKAAADGQHGRHAIENALDVVFALQMRERVAHAHGKVHAGRHEIANVADVPRACLNGQTVGPRLQLGEERRAEGDRDDAEADPCQCDGLKAGAASEVEGSAAIRTCRDAETLQQRALLGDLRLEVAEHA